MLMSKKIFLTGATSGIGRVTALNLARNGAHVFFTARKEALALELIRQFESTNPDSNGGSMDYAIADLSSFEEAKHAFKVYADKHEHLDVLINNAGIWNYKRKLSKNGIEEIFHVNLAIPVLYKQLFTPLLSNSSDPRIIQTASALHQGEINFVDPEFKSGYGNGLKSYRQSKLGMILLSRLWADQQLSAFSMHPGMVATKIGRDFGFIGNMIFKIFGITPEKGAETLTFLAEENRNNLENGEYYIFLKPRKRKASEQSKNLEIAKQLENLILNYIP